MVQRIGWIAAAFVIASIAVSFPAQAIDLNKYKAGTVPASGTQDEADTCSVVSALYWISAMNEPGYANPTPDDKAYYDRVENQTLYWLNRGISLSGKSEDAYMEEVKKNLGPVSEMGREVNFPHYERCLQIWHRNTNGAK